MFPGRIRKAYIPIVEEGLPSLNQAMIDAGIVTPRRIAAFLTTLCFESRFEYNIHQGNDTRLYAGRGFIQLTGLVNYTAAGKYFGIDLVNNPDLALSLDWSAKIARWYWTINRNCNKYADNLEMGKVNGAIGFPVGPNDSLRCEAFSKALQYLTGAAPVGISCTR